jgi:hypothetical protein
MADAFDAACELARLMTAHVDGATTDVLDDADVLVIARGWRTVRLAPLRSGRWGVSDARAGAGEISWTVDGAGVYDLLREALGIKNAAVA